MTRAQKIIIPILAAMLVVLGGIYVYRSSKSVTSGTPQDTTLKTLTYTNDSYGFAFDYPSTYVLSQRDVKATKDVQAHHQITLMLAVDAARITDNGEFPPSITFDIYKNPKKLSLSAWATSTKDSLYYLSEEQRLHTAVVAGQPAVAYVWSGLYQGSSYIFTQRGNIIVASVTYISPDNLIYSDFTEIMKTARVY